MGERFSLIPSATYIPQSPHEVLVKGGALEGFSLIIEDPSRLGITARIVTELEQAPRSADELHKALQADDKALQADVGPEQLESMLSDMESGGALLRLDRGSSPDADSAWASFVRYGYVPSETLLSEVTVVAQGSPDAFLRPATSWGVPVRVVSPGDIDLAQLQVAEERQDGGGTTSGGESARHAAQDQDVRSRTVFIADRAQRTTLMTFNREAVQHNVPVLYSSIDGADYTVGPYVAPGKTACMWETERQWARASADRQQYETLLRARERSSPATAFPAERHHHVAADAFGAALAPALLELSLRGTSGRGGMVLHGRATTSTLSEHTVMRLPRCPVCMPMQPAVRNPLY